MRLNGDWLPKIKRLDSLVESVLCTLWVPTKKAFGLIKKWLECKYIKCLIISETFFIKRFIGWDILRNKNYIKWGKMDSLIILGSWIFKIFLLSPLFHFIRSRVLTLSFICILYYSTSFFPLVHKSFIIELSVWSFCIYFFIFCCCKCI